VPEEMQRFSCVRLTLLDNQSQANRLEYRAMEHRSAAPARIMIIDDDVELCSLLRPFLAGEGFEIECCNIPAEGVRAVQRGNYDLILLDVMMPDMSGFEALRRIRVDSRTPVLMLTARGETQDRVLGLEMGADDYLAKPFDPPELAARVRAILRRVQSPPAADYERLVVADIEVDLASRTVWRNSRVLELTMAEFDLLLVLLRSPGALVGREQLVRDVLRRDSSPFDRSLDTHVYNLRKKLGPLPNGGERIKSIRGEGYLYAASVNPPGRS
jgi:DNA-binding response OmpR family regulator